MLRLYSPNSLALRAAIGGLFDSLGLTLLGGCLTLPLPFRESTTWYDIRAFSGYCVVLGTQSLVIN